MNLSIPGMCRRKPLNMGFESAEDMLLRMQRSWPESLLLLLLGNLLQRNGLPVSLQVRLLPRGPAFLAWDHGGQILFQPMQIMNLLACLLLCVVFWFFFSLICCPFTYSTMFSNVSFVLSATRFGSVDSCICFLAK